MLRHLLFAYQFNLDRGRVMVKDLSDEQMSGSRTAVNHPAWILGHLALSSDGLARRYGLPSTLPDGGPATFGAGGIPSGAVADFPRPAQPDSSTSWPRARAVAEVVATADPAVFETPFPDERRRQTFPTLGDYTAFVMTTHEGSHIGQIAAWRRAMGLGSATGI